MKILLVLMCFCLASCGGLFNSEMVDDSDKIPPRYVVEPLFVVVGNFPEEFSPTDIQVVAYQTNPARKIAPYKKILRFSDALVSEKNEISFYKIYIDKHVPANEIVWYNKGVPYQTLNIEYTVRNMEIVSIRAFENGKRELCLNNYFKVLDPRIHIHMPDNRMLESDLFTVFKDNPRCRETEK